MSSMSEQKRAAAVVGSAITKHIEAMPKSLWDPALALGGVIDLEVPAAEEGSTFKVRLTVRRGATWARAMELASPAKSIGTAPPVPYEDRVADLQKRAAEANSLSQVRY